MAQGNGQLLEQAKMVLDFNWIGDYTRPGPRLYPHQWSWDSALISLAYARYAPEKAISELDHLFDAQWSNGLLPQIVFNSDYPLYFPNANFWHADESPQAPKDARTSGIVQPPVHATAALALHRSAGDQASVQAFLKRAFPRLAAWHGYLYNERDPDDEGLVYIRHPWESGMDNSPMWDAIMLGLFLEPDDVPEYKRADTQVVSSSDRPESAEYDRFAYLVKFFADREYDEARIRKDCPFLVQDVLFNTLLVQAGRDLAEIAGALGEDPSPFKVAADKTAHAINDKLWYDEHGVYLDFDLVAGRPIRTLFSPNLAPLYAGIPDEKRARRVVEVLKSASFGLEDEEAVPVASYDRRGFGFSPVRYWRGPVWININWFLMHGLERYGYAKEAARLRQTIIGLCQNSGFYEYFDPADGSGHGSDFFSWTAALLIDVLSDDDER